MFSISKSTQRNIGFKQMSETNKIISFYVLLLPNGI